MAEILDANTAGIETDATGWTVSANCTKAQSSAQAHSGSNSLAVTNTAGGADASVFAGLFAVSPSTLYRFSAWCRAAVTGRWCYLFINWYDAGLTGVGNASPGGVTSSSSAWTQTGDTVLSPATAVWARPYLVFQPTGASEVCYWDDISFKPNTDFSPIAPVNLNRANSNTGVAATTFDFVLSGLTIGNTLIIRGAADNSGTNGAARTLTVSNQSGSAMGTHTEYQKLNDPGAASAGTQCDVSVIKIAATSGTIRFTYSGSVVFAGIAEEWTGIGGVVGTPVTANSVASTNLPSLTDASVADTGMAYSAIAIEGPSTDTITKDADVTGGSWFALTKVGGTNATADLNQTTYAEYKIVNGTAAQTNNPTINNARDSAGIIIEFSPSTLVTPSVVAVTVAMPTATAPATPGVIAAVVSMPSAVAKITATPGVVAATVGMPTATATTAVGTPIAVTVAMPSAAAPTVVAPGVVAATVGMPTATAPVTAGSPVAAVVGMPAATVAITTPAVGPVAAVVAMPSAVADIIAAPGVIAAVVALDAPSVVVQEGTTVTPGAIAAVVAMPAAVVAITATPSAIAATVGMPTAGVSITQPVSTLAVVVAMPSATVPITPGAIGVVVSMPSAAVPAAPGALAVIVAMPAAVPAITATPGVVAAIVAMPAATPGITATPGVIAVVVAMPSTGLPTIAAPDTLAVLVYMATGSGACLGLTTDDALLLCDGSRLLLANTLLVGITTPAVGVAAVVSMPTASAPAVATSPVAVVVGMPSAGAVEAPGSVDAVVAIPSAVVPIRPGTIAVVVAIPTPDANFVIAAPATLAVVVDIPMGAGAYVELASGDFLLLVDGVYRLVLASEVVRVAITTPPVGASAVVVMPSPAAEIRATPSVIAVVVAFPSPAVAITAVASTLAVLVDMPGTVAAITAVVTEVAVVVDMPEVFVPQENEALAETVAAIVDIPGATATTEATDAPSTIAVIVGMGGAVQPIAVSSVAVVVAIGTGVSHAFGFGLIVLVSMPGVTLPKRPGSVAVIVAMPGAHPIRSVGRIAVVVAMPTPHPFTAATPAPGTIAALVGIGAATAFGATVSPAASLAVLVLLPAVIVRIKGHIRARGPNMTLVGAEPFTVVRRGDDLTRVLGEPYTAVEPDELTRVSGDDFEVVQL